MVLTKLFKDFVNSEKSGGVLLICCTLLSLFLTNSSFQQFYVPVWQLEIAGHTFVHWINDGLMSIFFLLIGLELEREIYFGELSNPRNALLPIVAATGGMLIPAGLFLLLNFGLPTQSGAGIPMATDIAFAIAILSLLGNRVPPALKIMLTALAVIDDLGAIIVIAIFYTQSISWWSLLASMSIWGALLLLNRFKVNNLWPYLAGGIAMWYFMLHSGVHATITGVLLAFAIPFRDGSERSPSHLLQHALHKPVAFIILPLFALANTALSMDGLWYQHLGDSNSLGILAGLALGKPLGIFIFSFVAVSTGLCALPQGIGWKQVLGIGFLGGIGFTMSIFITLLAFDHAERIDQSKVAILCASLLSAVMGFAWLYFILDQRQSEDSLAHH